MDLFEQLANALLCGDSGTFMSLLFEHNGRFLATIRHKLRTRGLQSMLEADEVFNLMAITFAERFDRERASFQGFLERRSDYTPTRAMRGRLARRIDTRISDMIADRPKGRGGEDDASPTENAQRDDGRRVSDPGHVERIVDRLGQLNSKHRVIYKLIYVEDHRDLPPFLSLSAEERAWHPERKHHPSARTAGELFDAIDAVIKDRTHVQEISDPWVAATLQLSGTPKQAQNTVAAWKKHTRIKVREILEDLSDPGGADRS